MAWNMRNIGALLKLAIGIDPANDDGAAAINGASIDRQNLESCVLHAACGAATGTPTTQTVDAKLQDSADGSTGWADITGASVAQMTGDDEDQYKDIDLSGAKRYVRAVVTVAFTGGTSPKIPVACTIALGGAKEKPLA